MEKGPGGIEPLPEISIDRLGLQGVEIPPQFTEFFRRAMDAIDEIEKRAGVKIDHEIRIGFAEEIAQCQDDEETRSAFLCYFNQICEEYGIDGVVDAEDLLVGLGLIDVQLEIEE